MTAAPGVVTPSAESLRLRDVAELAFHERLLPAIRQRMPQIADCIVVTITSSVAYGTADQYSDLDVFVIFRRHRDYREHASALERLIEALDFASAYGDVCDKGVRFELESLERSDLSGLYWHPERAENWHRQTEWLLCWFLDSVPIYDPGGIHERLNRRAGSWPDAIAQERRRASETKVCTWSESTLLELHERGMTFSAVRAACRAATAGLDLAYLTAGRYGPHPKWRHGRAGGLIGAHPAAGAVLAAVDQLIAQILRPSTKTSQLRIALIDYMSRTVTAENSGSQDWREELQRYALPFTEPAATTWVTCLRDPGPRHHAATRAAAKAGEKVYLADELGADHLLRTGYSYDQALRIADPLRWLVAQTHHLLTIPVYKLDETSAISRRRWLYLNFILWRKLRVVDKARRRGQAFTCRWYQIQVVDHVVEAFARMQGTVAPPVHRYSGQTLDFLDGGLREMLILDDAFVPLLVDVDRFLEWGWRHLGSLQERLVSSGDVPASAVADPLTTQWDCQYWKYENLFV